jgi:hypothetical protein
MNKYNIIPYTAGTVCTLLLGWFIVSFLDVAANNIHGAVYLPFNFFEMRSKIFHKYLKIYYSYAIIKR